MAAACAPQKSESPWWPIPLEKNRMLVDLIAALLCCFPVRVRSALFLLQLVPSAKTGGLSSGLDRNRELCFDFGSALCLAVFKVVTDSMFKCQRFLFFFIAWAAPFCLAYSCCSARCCV